MFCQIISQYEQELQINIKDEAKSVDLVSTEVDIQSQAEVVVEPQVPVVRLINDGRVEPFSSDRAIFPETDGIKIYTPQGDLVLFIPVANIELIGVRENGSNLLGEAEDGYVRVYVLSDGRYMTLIGPDFEGKTHVTFWNGLGFAENETTTTIP